jgi:hypothetical protein
MALTKGILVSFDDPVLGVVPTFVAFQFNPTQMTRVFRSQEEATTPRRKGSALNAANPPFEDYSLKLEFDATDGLEVGGPITRGFGISPRLAAIEMLMQPVGTSLLGRLVGGAAASIPARRVPLVLFVWGPGRVTPVRLKSLTITETEFDELLNPIHATADLGFTVLRVADLPRDQRVARAAATYYQGLREIRTALQAPQMGELTQGVS